MLKVQFLDRENELVIRLTGGTTREIANLVFQSIMTTISLAYDSGKVKPISRDKLYEMAYLQRFSWFLLSHKGDITAKEAMKAYHEGKIRWETAELAQHFGGIIPVYGSEEDLGPRLE